VRAEPTTEKDATRTSLFASVGEYVKDVRVEMTKVTWPPRTELRESTVVVIVMVIIVSIFIGIVDRALSLAFESLLRLLG
jgi:preprotein translocase subunit SecE